MSIGVVLTVEYLLVHKYEIHIRMTSLFSPNHIVFVCLPGDNNVVFPKKPKLYRLFKKCFFFCQAPKGQDTPGWRHTTSADKKQLCCRCALACICSCLDQKAVCEHVSRLSSVRFANAHVLSLRERIFIYFFGLFSSSTKVNRTSDAHLQSISKVALSTIITLIVSRSCKYVW